MVSQHKYIFMSLVNQICGSAIEVNSVVRRIEKRTKKKILLPGWSSGGVLYSSFYLRCRECLRESFTLKKSWLLMTVLSKFLVSTAEIVFGEDFLVIGLAVLKPELKVLFCCVRCYPSSETSTFTRARGKSGILILSWLWLILCLLTCFYLVLYLLLSYLLMLRSSVSYKYQQLPKSLIKQEVLDLCCSHCSGSSVFELRRCVGIRMCNSNTPINSSISYLITMLARPHIGVLVCTKETNHCCIRVCILAYVNVTL